MFSQDKDKKNSEKLRAPDKNSKLYLCSELNKVKLFNTSLLLYFNVEMVNSTV